MEVASPSGHKDHSTRTVLIGLLMGATVLITASFAYQLGIQNEYNATTRSLSGACNSSSQATVQLGNGVRFVCHEAGQATPWIMSTSQPTILWDNLSAGNVGSVRFGPSDYANLTAASYSKETATFLATWSNFTTKYVTWNLRTSILMVGTFNFSGTIVKGTYNVTLVYGGDSRNPSTLTTIFTGIEGNRPLSVHTVQLEDKSGTQTNQEQIDAAAKAIAAALQR